MTLPTALAAIAWLAAMAGSPVQPAWTWTLYEGEGPVVLANEVPDSPQLRTTLECAPGSGVARLSLYDAPLTAGFASVTSGAAATQAQAEAGRDGRLSLAVRTDHPVFGQFVATGDLAVAVGDQRQTLAVEPAHLAKLRRFADLCGG